MGNLVGILSTVILVSTLATLVFAVFAYVGSRKRQKTVKVQPHSGQYKIPASQSAPALPEEFVLKVHDVHRLHQPASQTPTMPDAKPVFNPINARNETPVGYTEAKPDKVPEVPVAEEIATPPAGTPAFRSLADKKKAAAGE